MRTVRKLMVAPSLKAEVDELREAPSQLFISLHVELSEGPSLLPPSLILTPRNTSTMYSTLFTTTLFFALTALRVRADFNVDTIELTQVSDSPKISPFPRFFPLISSRLDHSANLQPSTGVRPMVPTMSLLFLPTSPAATPCT